MRTPGRSASHGPCCWWPNQCDNFLRCRRWNMDTQLERSQPRPGLVGRALRARICLESPVETPLLPCLKPLWAPVRPASRCRSLLVLTSQVSMPRPLVFSADSLYPVQDTSCFDRAVSHGFVGVLSVGKSGGKGTLQTSPAHLARSLPDVGTQFALVGHPELSWCHAPRTSAGRNEIGRRFGANPRRSREFNVKRNVYLWHNPEISHEAAEVVLRSQAPPRKRAVHRARQAPFHCNRW